MSSRDLIPHSTQPSPVPATVPAATPLSTLEREFLPAVLEIQESPPSPYQRAVIWTIAMFTLVAIIWSVVGTLEVVSTAPGRLIPDGRVKVAQVAETAIVKAIHVKEGQQVKAGDLLMELDPAIAQADLSASAHNLAQSQLDAARLQAELSGTAPSYGPDRTNTMVQLQEALRLTRQQAHADRMASLQTQLREKEAEEAANMAMLDKYRAVHQIAQEKERRFRELLDQNFISRVEYLHHQRDWVAADNDVKVQSRSIERARQATVEARQMLTLAAAERRAELLKELNENAAARPDLQRSSDKAREIHALKWLRAPVSGYIQSVSVTTTGGVVTPAQPLVTIVPDGTPLVVEASLSNEDVGYVKVGQPVDIKLDTYPYQRYGALRGTLTSISPDSEHRDHNAATGAASLSASDRDARPDPGAERPAATYRVRVTLDRDSRLMVDGRPARLLPGMSGQADIKTDRRKIYEFFLSPVVKYLDEGTRVR